MKKKSSIKINTSNVDIEKFQTHKVKVFHEGSNVTWLLQGCSSLQVVKYSKAVDFYKSLLYVPNLDINIVAWFSVNSKALITRLGKFK